MNQLSKLGIDNYITSDNRNEIDYKEEAKRYFDTTDSIIEALELVPQDLYNVLEENDLPYMARISGFIDTWEFYELLFNFYEESLIKIYLRSL